MLVGFRPVPRNEEAENSGEHGKDDDCSDDDRDFRGSPHREDCPQNCARCAANDHAGGQGHVKLDHAAVFVSFLLWRMRFWIVLIDVCHVEPPLATPQAVT